MRSRLGLALLAVVVVVTIPIGRWEGSRAVGSQLRGIERVRAEVGPNLIGASLTAVSRVDGLECLLYKRGGYVYALELCVDSAGRLVRALDATGSGDARLWSVSFQPSVGRLLLPPDRLAEPEIELDRRYVVEALQIAGTSDMQRCTESVWIALDRKLSTPARRRNAVKTCSTSVRINGEGVAAATRLGAEPLTRSLRALGAVVRTDLAVARTVAAAGASLTESARAQAAARLQAS